MTEPWPKTTQYATESATLPRDVAIAEVAARQEGLVAGAQLHALGLSPSGIRSRVRRGRLHRVHQGVYAVGHPVVSLRGRWWGAVLACGPGAVLSHRTAASAWGLRPDNRPVMDVTAKAGRGRAGIRVHRSLLHPTEVARAQGVPSTSVHRTILDAAEHVDRRGVERMVDRAEQLRVFDLTALEAGLARAANRHGAAVIRDVLSAYSDPALTRNELEECMFAICVGADLPQPCVNHWIALPGGGGYEADFAWPDHRLIAETDGRAAHGTRRAFAHDRRRDRLLTMAGWRVVRFTYTEVIHEPHVVAATLAALLRRSRRSG